MKSQSSTARWNGIGWHRDPWHCPPQLRLIEHRGNASVSSLRAEPPVAPVGDSVLADPALALHVLLGMCAPPDRSPPVMRSTTASIFLVRDGGRRAGLTLAEDGRTAFKPAKARETSTMSLTRWDRAPISQARQRHGHVASGQRWFAFTSEHDAVYRLTGAWMRIWPRSEQSE